MKRVHVLLPLAILLLLIGLPYAGSHSQLGIAAQAPEARLKELILAYPDSALLHAQLASVHFAKGTVRGRSLAAKHLKWALRIDPLNIDYRLLLAEVYFEATFWNYGIREIRRVLEIDPGADFAHVRLGKAYLQRAIEEWQVPWFQRARDELGRVDILHPAYSEACRNLALCYIDLGLPDSSLALLQTLPEDSLDTNALLILGMAYCEKNQMEASYDAFSRALSAMDDQRRKRFLSIELIATPEELKGIAEPTSQNQEEVMELLWKKRDPNPATLVNERLVEHLARVAFADFHFSVPRLGKIGSETSRGEVYIRYGRPLAWFYDPFGTRTYAGETALPRPAYVDLSTLLGRGSSQYADVGAYYRSRPFRIEKPRWKWQYEDFALNFEDTFLNGDYTFPFELDPTAYTYAYLEENVPEIYELQIGKRMKVALDALNFVDHAGRALVKIIYACDTRGLKYQPHVNWPKGDFEVEIAVLDSTYHDLVRSRFSTQLIADSSALYQTEYPLIGTYIVHVPPGTSLAAVSIQSRKTEAVGFTSSTIQVRRFDPHLQISDIELRFAQEGPPNPSHVYLRRGTVFLAFSIYNVMTDEYGTGDLEVSYRITKRQEPRPRLKRFLSFLSGDTRRDISRSVTSLWSKYDLKTRGRREDQVIGIDLSPLSSGDYEIEIEALDRTSGRMARGKTQLRIASELDL